MAAVGFAQSMNLVTSQLEAAATLLKYAVDDLRELAERDDVPMPQELRLIVQNMLSQAAVIDGTAAFCVRLGEDAAENTSTPNRQSR